MHIQYPMVLSSLRLIFILALAFQGPASNAGVKSCLEFLSDKSQEMQTSVYKYCTKSFSPDHNADNDLWPQDTNAVPPQPFYKLNQSKTMISPEKNDGWQIKVHGDPEFSVVSENRASEIHKILHEKETIPFHYSKDGCSARAYAMALTLDRLGVRVAKLFIDSKTKKLTPRLSSAKAFPLFYWHYHVAIVLGVEGKNGMKLMVIDPALYEKPVSIVEWAKAQTYFVRREKVNLTISTRFSNQQKDLLKQPKEKWMARDIRIMHMTLRHYCDYI